MKNLKFTGRTITGSGRGKRIGVPTINLALEDIPPALEEGIYACFVTDHRFPAAVHYGPRPVFNDSKTFEIHLLDAALVLLPKEISVEIVAYLRPVKNFHDVDGLKAQITKDIADARAILKAHDDRSA
ncbi:MAG: hypothetical protein RIQ56_732 [Candidatus Parcubacteria bacterium]